MTHEEDASKNVAEEIEKKELKELERIRGELNKEKAKEINEKKKKKRLEKLRNDKKISEFKEKQIIKDSTDNDKSVQQDDNASNIEENTKETNQGVNLQNADPLVDNLKKEGDKPKKVYVDEKEVDEWLRILHERYSERYLKDNDRIWTVSSIFIPLSLAGLSSVKDGHFASTSILALASIGLILFWYLTCEKHRAFQDSSKSVADGIETYIKFQKNEKKVDPFSPTNEKKFLVKWIHSAFYKHDVNIQKGRELILYLVIGLWFIASCYSAKVTFYDKKDEPKSSEGIQIENKYYHKDSDYGNR